MAARGPEPRARHRWPHSPRIRGELLLKRAATAAARKRRVCGKFRGQRPLQVPRHWLRQQEAAPNPGISPQNVPGSSEELAVASGHQARRSDPVALECAAARDRPRPPPPGSAPPPAPRGPRVSEKPAGEGTEKPRIPLAALSLTRGVALDKHFSRPGAPLSVL